MSRRRPNATIEGEPEEEVVQPPNTTKFGDGQIWFFDIDGGSKKVLQITKLLNDFCFLSFGVQNKYKHHDGFVTFLCFFFRTRSRQIGVNDTTPMEFENEFIKGKAVMVVQEKQKFKN